jgi:hypothetical protein
MKKINIDVIEECIRTHDLTYRVLAVMSKRDFRCE